MSFNVLGCFGCRDEIGETPPVSIKDRAGRIISGLVSSQPPTETARMATQLPNVMTSARRRVEHLFLYGNPTSAASSAVSVGICTAGPADDASLNDVAPKSCVGEPQADIELADYTANCAADKQNGNGNLSAEKIRLATRPENIAALLGSDAAFHQAYYGFISGLVQLGNGSIRIRDREALQRGNQVAMAAKEKNEIAWQENSSYGAALDALTVPQAATIAVDSQSAQDTLAALLTDMRARPTMPICWNINGNNHFPTHQGLRDMLAQVAHERRRLNAEHGLQVRNMLVISGDVAAKSPYGPGLLGKYTINEETHPDNGTVIGTTPEAQAIYNILFNDSDGIDNQYDIILETKSKNTRENLENTIARLKARGGDISSHIMVNSQSGFSGLRSALLMMGWQNNQNLPDQLYFINPDLTPEQSVRDMSYQFTGQTFLQAAREFMNLSADIARQWFIPVVTIPQELADDFKTCLRKIGIDPETVPAQLAQDMLMQMHALAMTPDDGRVVPPEQNYAEAIHAYVNDHQDLRTRQDAIKKIMRRWPERSG